LIPWKDIPEDEYLTSDAHNRDPDGQNIDRYGNCGHKLWEIAQENIPFLFCLGDLLNYPSRRSLLEIMYLKTKMPFRAIVGNHDLDMLNAELASYHDKDYMLFGNDDETIGMHGHQAQSLWNPNKKVARRSIGQWIVRLGDAMEQVVPWSDNAITEPASKLSHLPFIPRGWKDGRSTYLDWGAKELCKHAVHTLVHGHDHEPGVFEYMGDGIWTSYIRCSSTDVLKKVVHKNTSHDAIVRRGSVIVDTGSFMPAHKIHPHGWYVKNDVAPFTWGVSERTFYRICPDGLEPLINLKEKI